MNRSSRRGSELEMRWHFIVAADQPRIQSAQLVMNWISTASPHSGRNI